MWCHVLYYGAMWYGTAMDSMWSDAMWCDVLSCNVIFMRCRVIWCEVMWNDAMERDVMWSCCGDMWWDVAAWCVDLGDCVPWTERPQRNPWEVPVTKSIPQSNLQNTERRAHVAPTPNVAPYQLYFSRLQYLAIVTWNVQTIAQSDLWDAKPVHIIAYLMFIEALVANRSSRAIAPEKFHFQIKSRDTKHSKCCTCHEIYTAQHFLKRNTQWNGCKQTWPKKKIPSQSTID